MGGIIEIMGVEENKAATRRLYDEVINQGQLHLAGNFISDRAIENEDINASGLESLKEFYSKFRKAFPPSKI